MSLSELFTAQERFDRIEKHLRETFGGFDGDEVDRRIHHNADDETREVFNHDPTLFVDVDDLGEAREIIDELESKGMEVKATKVSIRARER